MSRLLAVKRTGKRRASFGFRTVDFPSLDHFMEDARDAGVSLVRIDIFPYQEVSELSFVHYLSLLLSVTALDVGQQVVFQYQEAYETQPSLAPDVTDEVALRRVNQRLSDVVYALHCAGFQTAHGRFLTDEL